MMTNLSSLMFQFTLPRGERRLTTSQTRLTVAFQFTLPRGERRFRRPRTYLGGRFQFTLPRGERRGYERGWIDRDRFNSRSREGSDNRG